jgi:tetratricopeptide (TPR) repeat protein
VKSHRAKPSVSKRSAAGANATEGAKSQFIFQTAKGKFGLAKQDYGEAHDYFKAASEVRHSDFKALMQYFFVWRLWRAQTLNQRGVNLIEVDSYKKEAADILKKIISHPNATQSAQIEAHMALYNDLIRLDQEAPAMEELKAVVAIDPRNKEALDRLSAFEIKRGRPMAARAFLEDLKKSTSLSREYVAKLVEIQLLQDSLPEALVTTEEGLKKFPNDFELLALKASALAMNGRLEEARNLNDKLLKKDPKNQRVFDSQSRVLEKEGDLSRSQGFPGKALAEYKSGLDLSPARLSLRIKMASLIFDYRRDQDFKPKAVTQKDMNEVVRLLLPTLEADPPREDVLLLFLQSAKRSDTSSQALPICSKMESPPKGFPTVNAVLDCSEIYMMNGQENTAKRILEAAVFNPKFSSSKDKLKEAYQALKKP